MVYERSKGDYAIYRRGDGVDVHCATIEKRGDQFTVVRFGISADGIGYESSGETWDNALDAAEDAANFNGSNDWE